MQWRFGNFEKWAEDNESTPLSLVANAHDEIIIIVRDKLTKYCFHTEALGSHLTFANDVLLFAKLCLLNRKTYTPQTQARGNRYTT